MTKAQGLLRTLIPFYKIEPAKLNKNFRTSFKYDLMGAFDLMPPFAPFHFSYFLCRTQEMKITQQFEQNYNIINTINITSEILELGDDGANIIILNGGYVTRAEDDGV